MENNLENELPDNVIQGKKPNDKPTDPLADEMTNQDEPDLGDADGSGGELKGGGEDLDG